MIKRSLHFLWILALLLGISWTVTMMPAKKRHGPPPPTPTPAPSATPPQLTLAWNASAGANGYHLCLGFAPGNEPMKIDVGNVLVSTVKLSSGTTYYFVVTAYNSGGESLPSNEVSYTTPP